MFEFLSIVVSAIMAIASQTSPNSPNFVYIAKAKTNSLASSVLTPSKIAQDEAQDEKVANYDQEHKISSETNIERKNDTMGLSVGMAGSLHNELGEEIVAKEVVCLDPPKNEIVAMILKEFPEEPLMVKIADCESIGLRHYIKGGVLRGNAVKEDIGLFQINETHWLKEAEKLGIDIYDLEGNIKMARHIYDTQGLSAWSASYQCWKNL